MEGERLYPICVWMEVCFYVVWMEVCFYVVWMEVCFYVVWMEVCFYVVWMEVCGGFFFLVRDRTVFLFCVQCGCHEMIHVIFTCM